MENICLAVPMSDSLVLSLTAAIKSTGARDVREGKHIYVYDRQIYIYSRC